MYYFNEHSNYLFKFELNCNFFQSNHIYHRMYTCQICLEQDVAICHALTGTSTSFQQVSVCECNQLSPCQHFSSVHDWCLDPFTLPPFPGLILSLQIANNSLFTSRRVALQCFVVYSPQKLLC